jgi:hypothetical protein
MGRPSKGAILTKESKRISISFLKNHGYFEPEGKDGKINFRANDEYIGNISLSSHITDEPHVQLTYIKTNNSTGEKVDIKYKIALVKVPSNLGRGFRYYFLCPFSNKKCETLYMAYGSPHFKHREAYRHRIYYRCQMESKTGLCYNYHNLERQIEELYSKMTKSHYKGIKTRLVKRIEELERKSGLAEDQFNSMIAKLR